MLRKCSKCGKRKSIKQFSPSKKAKDGLSSWCKKCNNNYAKKYRRTHKVEIRERSKKYRQTETGKLKYKGPERDWKNRYGVTLEQYDRMFDEQNEVCAICGGINKNGRRLSIDHDHKTGKIRALLCQNCNVLLGNAKENIIILQSSINYLKKHKT